MTRLARSLLPRATIWPGFGQAVLHKPLLEIAALSMTGQSPCSARRQILPLPDLRICL